MNKGPALLPRALAVAGLALLSACATTQPAPDPEVLRQQALAAEQQRAAAEQARKDKADQLAALEQKADAAAKSGKHKADALAQYTAALALADAGSADDTRLREKAIKLGNGLHPEVPDEAMRHAVRGRARFQSAAPGDYAAAVDEFQQAVTLAPWWGQGYRALWAAQEADRQYAGALRSLKLYELAAPRDEQKALKTKQYELELAVENAQMLDQLNGTWVDAASGARLTAKVEGGNHLTVTGYVGRPLVIRTDIQGAGLKGFAESQAYRYDYCDIPGETTPASGKIAADGSSMEMEFPVSYYITDKSWVGLCCGMYTCTQVTLSQKSPLKLNLHKAAP